MGSRCNKLWGNTSAVVDQFHLWVQPLDTTSLTEGVPQAGPQTGTDLGEVCSVGGFRVLMDLFPHRWNFPA